MSTVIALILVLLAAGCFERWRTRQARLRLPIRIHVNGTRGKSSVTRLIAAGLRAGGLRVATKTTGTAPRYIDPDGRESALNRPAGTAIREQASVLRRAAADGADGIVIECMALQPETLTVSEEGFLQSTIGVITNVRADHLDLMGPTVTDVARNLARTAPRRGRCFTSERDPLLLAILDEVCRSRGATLEVIVAKAPPGWAEGFGHIEHDENVALALAVCGSLGVDAHAALAGMKTATPDPGALRILEIASPSGAWFFANGFAANDPDSTTILWNHLRELHPIAKRVLVVTTRPDRVQRASQFGSALAGSLAADHVLVAGPLSSHVLRHARAAGLRSKSVEDLGDASASILWNRIEDLATDRTIVFGCGNIAGTGQQLAEMASAKAIGRPGTASSTAA